MRPAGATVRAGFTDPVSGQERVLVIEPGGLVTPWPGGPKIGVAHPGCGGLADLAVELDAYWCPQCGQGGRISGAWAVDVVRSSR